MAFLSSEMKILTHEEVKQIHEASLRIIERVGMKIEHERMLKLLQEIGASVDFNSMVVKFPRKLVEDCIERQVLKSNGGEKNNEDYFDVGGSVPLTPGRTGLTTHIFCTNIYDKDTGKIRPAKLKDLEDATIVANELKNVTGIGPLVVPDDVPVEVNDAYMWAVTLKRSKKRVSGEMLNLGTVPYIYEMCCIAAGSEEALKKDPLIMFPSFPTSPLSYSRYALEIAFSIADRGMPVRYGGAMVVAGFSSPVTLAGALTVGNAESLASFVIAEAVGGNTFGSLSGGISFNQANGTALYASPEKHLLNFAVRDLAKFYGFKGWRGSGHTTGADSCSPGLQAGIEKGISSMLCNIAGFGCGMCGMVSPEVACIPQMVIDEEIIDCVNRISKGIRVDEETIACDLIERLGIHGNYIDPSNDEALDHLVGHFRQEHWMPGLFVRERPQQWQASRKDMYELAKEKVKKILTENDPHPLGEDREKEIDRILKKCVENHTG